MLDQWTPFFKLIAREGGTRKKTYLFEWIGSFSLRWESLDFFRSHRLVQVADLISSLSLVLSFTVVAVVVVVVSSNLIATDSFFSTRGAFVNSRIILRRWRFSRCFSLFSCHHSFGCDHSGYLLIRYQRSSWQTENQWLQRYSHYFTGDSDHQQGDCTVTREYIRWCLFRHSI